MYDIKNKSGAILVPTKVVIKYIERTLLPKEYEQVEKNRKIGATIYTKDRPMSHDEESYILPDLVKVSKDATDWATKVNDYWMNIQRRVPEDGLKLEVGFRYLTEENKALGEALPINQRTKYGYPINPADYVLYRHCLVYGRCANSIEDIDKSPKIRFYIYDPEIEIREQRRITNLRKVAYKHYMEVSDENPQLLKDILVSVGKIVADETFISDAEQFVINEPERYLALAKDERLPVRAFIERAIKARVLNRIENTDIIMFGETEIGKSIQEAITELLDEKNQGLKGRIEAQVAQVGIRGASIAPLSKNTYSPKDIEHIDNNIQAKLKEAEEAKQTAELEAETLLANAKAEADRIIAEAMANSKKGTEGAKSPEPTKK